MSQHRTSGQRRPHLPLKCRVPSRVGPARKGAHGADGGQSRRGRFHHFGCGGDRSQSTAGRIWGEEGRRGGGSIMIQNVAAAGTSIAERSRSRFGFLRAVWLALALLGFFGGGPATRAHPYIDVR